MKIMVLIGTFWYLPERARSNYTWKWRTIYLGSAGAKMQRLLQAGWKTRHHRGKTKLNDPKIKRRKHKNQCIRGVKEERGAEGCGGDRDV
jgi:hypothetical protein